jgi:hypothetical protein
MRAYNEYQKIVALSLAGLLMLMFSGCYSLKEIHKGEIQYAEGKYYYIHGTNSTFQINNVSISDGVLSGSIAYAYAQEKIKKKDVINLYVAPDSAIQKNGAIISIPFENIAKAELNKVDGSKTVVIGGGIAVGAFYTVFLIYWIAKGGSCPFIYSDDGSNTNFEGEIYSGATAIPLERDDYLWLKNIKPVDNLYKISISNEVKEIQNTNLAELIVFDHSPGTNILVDKYGNAHTLADTKKPVSAVDNYGRSLTDEISFRDSIRYISQVQKDLILYDTVSLTFEKPANAVNSKLVISAKNTMWLDYMFVKFTDLFGNRYDNWKEKRNEKPQEELLKWSFDQGMPLSVYLETDKGLVFADYFNLAGPMADKEDVLILDLSDISGDKVSIKLVSGLLFWDIDFIGMDFSPDQATIKTVVPLASATDENGKNVSDLLIDDDDRYLIQPDITNITSVTFPAPSPVQGMNRSMILHSKGNYEILRDGKGKPDVAYLKGFIEPGSFTRFSKDHFLQFYQKGN